MEAKFTKGPWEVDPKAEFNVRVVGAGRSICSTGGYTTNADHGEHVEENRRNARFIAAAPELYEKSEFKQNVIIHDNPDFEGEWIAVPREDFVALRAVRAKARGET